MKFKRAYSLKEDFSKRTEQGYEVVEIATSRSGRKYAIIHRPKTEDYLIAAGYRTDRGDWDQGYYDYKTLEDARNSLDKAMERAGDTRYTTMREGYSSDRAEDIAEYYFDGNAIYNYRDGLSYENVYEDLIDGYAEEENVAKKAAELVVDAWNTVKNHLYKDDNTPLVELSDNHTLWKIDGSNFDSDSQFEEVYQLYLQDAIDEFQAITGVELYLLGRSGRHVCVDLDYHNAVNFDELQSIQKQLERKLVKNVSNWKKGIYEESLKKRKIKEGMKDTLDKMVKEESLNEEAGEDNLARKAVELSNEIFTFLYRYYTKENDSVITPEDKTVLLKAQSAFDAIAERAQMRDKTTVD